MRRVLVLSLTLFLSLILGCGESKNRAIEIVKKSNFLTSNTITTEQFCNKVAGAIGEVKWQALSISSISPVKQNEEILKILKDNPDLRVVIADVKGKEFLLLQYLVNIKTGVAELSYIEIDGKKSSIAELGWLALRVMMGG
jgi:hypothetical protein